MNSPSRVFLVAVLISAIAYDYFFLPPVYNFTIATNEGVIDFGLFVLIALIVSALAARVRRYAQAADARALTTETLSAFIQRLAEGATTHSILHHAAEQMSALLDMPVALVLADEDVPVVNAACPPHVVPDTDCLRTAVEWWALRSEKSGNQWLLVGEWRFHTLRGAGEPLGLIATRPAYRGKAARAPQHKLLGVLIYQTGLAIDRIMLRERLDQSRARAETEQLRSTVLTSISHDLRNPLASITAAASVLERHWKSIDDASKLLMARTIRGEADRLDGCIGKLLDLTNIQHKMVKPHCQPIFVPDVVEAALHPGAVYHC